MNAIINAKAVLPGGVVDNATILHENGRIVAVGSHEQLLSTCPAYAHMVELQRLEDEAKQ